MHHGLARREQRDDAAIEGLAGAIRSGLGPEVASDIVIEIARAKLELSRVRAIRHAMLVAILRCPIAAGVARLKGLDRYERAALVRQKRALRCQRTTGG
ncbi:MULTISPECIES: hypothetical protein [unclassified Bradyrhizobium]